LAVHQLPLHFVSTSGHPKERKVDIVQKPEQGAKEKKSCSEYEATSQYKKGKNDKIKKVLM
jgi:hypothetical protein